MEPSDQSVRQPQVCQACKLRHRKCDWDEDVCSNCRNASIECVRQPTFQFRYHPKQKALSSPSSNLWKPCSLPRVPLRFYDETPDLIAIYEEDEPPVLFPNSLWEEESQHITPAASFVGNSIDSANGTQRDSSVITPADAILEDVAPLTPIEAFLVRNFTDRMAQWADIADPFRAFETTVSQLALTDHVIRYAICAFSARHYYRCQKGEDGEGEALDYQNRCLSLLIPAMSGRGKITASVLTAVGLLRQNEEMDEQDNRFHLEGASRIMNMVPEFATVGGVGEAASWLCLREEIYISLTTETPIKIGLDSFLDSLSIRRNDDHSWASKSILHLAFLLSRVYGEHRSTSGVDQCEAEIAQWYTSKPMTYEPILFEPRSRQEGRHFPAVWMLAPYHAVGLQYHHISQIVLNATRPQSSIQPNDFVAAARAGAQQIRHHLYMVLGLATSNERAENTWFTARHCLTVWGAYIKHPDDQLAVLEFLERWRQRSGWKTSALVESLRRQWDENVDDD